MKKFIKKLSAAILAGIMTVGLAVSASAASAQGSITVTKQGSTFSAYKILSATKSGDVYDYDATANFKGFFGNASYGNYTIEGLSKIPSDDINTNKPSISGVSPSEKLEEVTGYLQKYIKEKGIVADYKDFGSGAKQNIDLGYYLVVESSSKDYVSGDADKALGGTPGTAAVASKAMLVSVPNGDTFDVSMYPKDDGVTITKKIVEGSKKVDTNTVSIGEKVSYEIISTIPTYDSSYDKNTIKYQITDTMSKGLTYNADAVLKLKNGTTLKREISIQKQRKLSETIL